MPIEQEGKSYSHPVSEISYNSRMDQGRLNLLQAVADRGTTLSKVSGQADKNHAYLQQYVKRGVPTELPERVRHRIAEVLGIPDESLRSQAAPLGPTPEILADPETEVTATRRKRRQLGEGEIVEIDVRGGMGGGGFAQEMIVDGEVLDSIRATWRMPVDFLHSELRAREGDVEIIPVDGDSMLPTLLPGDRVMINRRQNVPSTDGLYAIGGPFGVQIKRLEYVQGSKEPILMRVISDNQLHSTVTLTVDEMHIIGRVICRISRL